MTVTIEINKEKFARNRFREKEVGSFFSKTSNSLSSATSLLLATPALITSSLFSKEILVPFANIFLSLGYITNFLYRLYKDEISKAELIVTVFAVTILLVVTFHFFPPIVVSSALSMIHFVNQIAGVINTFFLIKHVIVPPVKHLVEKIAHRMGFDISGQYYSKPLFTLEKDRHAIDRLLEKNYKHDSHSKHYQPEQVDNLNRLLKKLILYINRYDVLLFGYIRNKDKIAALEKNIEHLTVHGNSDSSYAFIEAKIRRKKTKLQLMQDAVAEVEQVIQDPGRDQERAVSFFHQPLFQTVENAELLISGLERLKEEAIRQQSKITSLEECLPLYRL